MSSTQGVAHSLLFEPHGNGYYRRDSLPLAWEKIQGATSPEARAHAVINFVALLEHKMDSLIAYSRGNVFFLLHALKVAVAIVWHVQRNKSFVAAKMLNVAECEQYSALLFRVARRLPWGRVGLLQQGDDLLQHGQGLLVHEGHTEQPLGILLDLLAVGRRLDAVKALRRTRYHQAAEGIRDGVRTELAKLRQRLRAVQDPVQWAQCQKRLAAVEKRILKC